MRTWCMVLSLLFAVAGSDSALAFEGSGCAAGECSSCHSLTKEDAKKLLKGVVRDVLAVEFSEVPGLWVVDVAGSQGQRLPIYIDFSKQHAISGNVVKLATRESLTKKRMIELNRTEFAMIPLDDAIVIGDPTAKNKIAVFTDPDCSHCRKLHPILQGVADSREDVAFYVKIYSINKKSYDKAKAIACSKSSAMLDEAMAGQEIEAPQGCDPAQLEANLALGRSLGVRSTPTLVFPDGRVVPGAKSAEQILQALDAGDRAEVAGQGGPG